MTDDTSGTHRDLSPASPNRSPDALLRAIMRRQARLSLGVAAVFLVLVLGLPLVNQYLPALAQARIGGFTATWLFLGVLFYPITWLLSAYFVRASETVEQEIGQMARGQGTEPEPGSEGGGGRG
jgi:uncharacterized membrane protein (DUF485 family)